jgi:hypothetical protein
MTTQQYTTSAPRIVYTALNGRIAVERHAPREFWLCLDGSPREQFLYQYQAEHEAGFLIEELAGDDEAERAFEAEQARLDAERDAGRCPGCGVKGECKCAEAFPTNIAPPVAAEIIPDPDGDFAIYACGDVRLCDDLTLTLDGRTLFGLIGDTPRARGELRQLRQLLNDARIVALLEA